MRFAGAAAVSVLARCAGGTPYAASAQQPAGVIQPVVATIEASPGPSLPGRPWMPSHVAGHLADRLQALHDTSVAANADRAETASRTLPSDAATAELTPVASPQTASDQAEQPKGSSALGISNAAPQPAAPTAPRRNPLAEDQPSFGIANPLRGSR